MALTDLQLRNAKPSDRPYKMADGGGLYMEVRPTGKKLWRYRYRIAGKENIYAIGEYPRVTLSAARAERDEAKDAVRQGLHPAHLREAERQQNITESANTFQAIALEFAEQKARTWSETYQDQFRRAMEQNVYPYIGTIPIRHLNSQHILEIMRRMDNRGATAYAIQVRQWCSAVFCYAASTMRADGDPAAAVKGAVQRRQINHARALEPHEIRDYLQRLQGFGGNRATGIALELMLYLFPRTAELRTAEWQDMHLADAQWRIPAEKMKMRRMHIVPLPRQAVALLEELQTITGNGRWLFPNTRRPATVMSATTINRALEYLGYPTGHVSGHDFRATASTRLNEMGYPEAHIEMQLAHAPRNKTAAAYNHAKYLPERERMMQDWADYLDSLRKGSKKVVGINRAKDGR